LKAEKFVDKATSQVYDKRPSLMLILAQAGEAEQMQSSRSSLGLAGGRKWTRQTET
jgi:hypothetical protein